MKTKTHPDKTEVTAALAISSAGLKDRLALRRLCLDSSGKSLGDVGRAGRVGDRRSRGERQEDGEGEEGLSGKLHGWSLSEVEC